jgi:hypothetical protein
MKMRQQRHAPPVGSGCRYLIVGLKLMTWEGETLLAQALQDGQGKWPYVPHIVHT